jgi:sulfur carrier protein
MPDHVRILISVSHAGILGPGVVGGGFLRTGCGPGPLEPAPGNAGEGNTARTDAAAPYERGAAVFVFMRITVNGSEMEVAEGLSVETLLAQLAVKREYTAVAVNREITPRAAYAAVALREGDRVEIVRPMGGG